jgi:XTP/dITP diphosphohydrolase
MSKPALVLATRNKGKIREYALLFKEFPVLIRTISEFKDIPEIKETGTSFEEIAKGKAQYVARMLGIPAIADDSGLEVEALHGAPGIFSARYGGEPSDDEANNHKLLDAMREKGNRRARFVCSIAVSKPSGQTVVYTGSCAGEIVYEARGKHGFGYDPLFFYPPLGKTFAELSAEEKSKVSHRGQAMRSLREDFQKIVVWMEKKNMVKTS